MGDYDGPPGVPHHPDPTEVDDAQGPAPTSLGDWCNCQGGPQGPWHPLGDRTCRYERSPAPATVPDGDPRVDILAQWRATGPWSSTTVREAERRQARDILAKLDDASGVIS